MPQDATAAKLAKTWGAAIRKQRLDAGETPTQLGAAVGVSAHQVYRLENGENAPSDQLRIKMARHYGIRVEELFAYPDTSTPAGATA